MKLMIALALFATAVGVACAFIQHRNRAASAERATLLARQSEQINDLQREQKSLSTAASSSKDASETVADHQPELTRLRAQAAAFRDQTNQLAKQTKGASRTSSSPGSAIESHPPEYWEQLHKAAGTKSLDARDIAAAVYMYAVDHRNQVPTNIDQAAKYLSEVRRAKPTTNRFELVFTGSLDQLKGIPHTSIALVRDTQTWTTSDGKQARVYGMMGGVGQIVTSDDDFQSWEAEHVISSPSK
jgi:hypothetical protein